MVRKLILLTTFLFIFSLGAVFAEDATNNAPPSPSLAKIHIMGKGIAVNPSELTDFKIIKAAVSSFAYNNTTLIRGAILLDQVRYIVKGTFEESKFVGGIYSTAVGGIDYPLEKVGDLTLTKIEKPDGEVWAGTLSLNSINYYAYIAGVQKTFTAKEVAQKVGDYCKENPTDDRCKGVAFVCNTPHIGQCADKIATYCESHPNDARCKAASKWMCKNNSDDTRCRQMLRSACATNSTDAVCQTLKTNVQNTVTCLSQCKTQANATCSTGTSAEKLVCMFREKATCLTKCATSNVLPTSSTETTAVNTGGA